MMESNRSFPLRFGRLGREEEDDCDDGLLADSLESEFDITLEASLWSALRRGLGMGSIGGGVAMERLTGITTSMTADFAREDCGRDF